MTPIPCSEHDPQPFHTQKGRSADIGGVASPEGIEGNGKQVGTVGSLGGNERGPFMPSGETFSFWRKACPCPLGTHLQALRGGCGSTRADPDSTVREDCTACPGLSDPVLGLSKASAGNLASVTQKSQTWDRNLKELHSSHLVSQKSVKLDLPLDE